MLSRILRPSSSIICQLNSAMAPCSQSPILGFAIIRPLTITKKLNGSGKNEDIETNKSANKDDYRDVRFVGKEKQVNTRLAIDLINEVPPNKEKASVVSCDGGGGPLGHPKVYINLDSPGNHACGYCGLRFYKEDHHH